MPFNARMNKFLGENDNVVDTGGNEKKIIILFKSAGQGSAQILQHIIFRFIVKNQ